MSTTVEAELTVRIGRSGAKTHSLRVSVRWDERRGEAAVYTGQTHCGSQRWGSGWYAVGIGTPITCERCNERHAYTDREVTYDLQGEPMRIVYVADPARALVSSQSLSSFRRIVPTAWAAELVTPKEV